LWRNNHQRKIVGAEKHREKCGFFAANIFSLGTTIKHAFPSPRKPRQTASAMKIPAPQWFLSCKRGEEKKSDQA
jgi:hypothetical protein